MAEPKPRKRKPRPSRGRGIRSTSGCQTCRSRRLKCGEERPVCANCTKSARQCVYTVSGEPGAESGSTSSPISESGAEGASSHSQGTRREVSSYDQTTPVQYTASGGLGRPSFSQQPSQQHQDIPVSPAEVVASPSTTTSFTAGTAPYHWYDLVARDAWKNAEQYNFLTHHGSRWSFNSSDVPSIPRLINQASPNLSSSVIQDWTNDPLSPQQNSNAYTANDGRLTHLPASYEHIRNGSWQQLRRSLPTDDNSQSQSWNTSEEIKLSKQEVKYLQHYVDVVSPLFDLFDPELHFQNHVLRAALWNEGILKSVLAVAALHRSFYSDQDPKILSVDSLNSPQDQAASSHGEIAAQYYYETISWLSKAMQIPGYAHSREILVNALLISWYEAFESDTSQNWERHLKGVFWIQRSQNNDGESTGIRKAIWWSWLRQDIWAAFRHNRRTLTIHRPTKKLGELTKDELACRMLFIQAKAVSYASPEAQQTLELDQRLVEGRELLALMDEWYSTIPADFKPLKIRLESDASNTATEYPPIWIHPPMFAAAMQAYHSARILVFLNMPSPGGVQASRERQKLLDECVRNICGVAAAPNALDPGLALCNSQALFIAGQSLSTSEHEKELLRLLRQALDVVKIPSRNLESELRQLWTGG